MRITARCRSARLVAVGVLGLLAGCSGESAQGDRSGDASGRHTVTYRVEGTREALINYSSDAGSGTETTAADRLPWTHQVVVDGSVAGMSVSAQLSYVERGEVTCAVLVDGAEVATDRASGQGATVSCRAPKP